MILPYRILWLIAIPLGATGATGATGQWTLIWLLADILNGLMAIPNLIALLLLGPLVFRITRNYFGKQKQE